AQNKLRNDQRACQESCLSNISNLPVDDPRRVEDFQIATRSLITENSTQRRESEIVAFRGAHHQSDIGHEERQRESQEGLGRWRYSDGFLTANQRANQICANDAEN